MSIHVAKKESSSKTYRPRGGGGGRGRNVLLELSFLAR